VLTPGLLIEHKKTISRPSFALVEARAIENIGVIPVPPTINPILFLLLTFLPIISNSPRPLYFNLLFNSSQRIESPSFTFSSKKLVKIPPFGNSAVFL
jgi:hypothetical protein